MTSRLLVACPKPTRVKKRKPPGRDPEWLAWVRTFPCCKCGRRAPSEAHHTTFGRGKGQKAADNETMPLCLLCHEGLHKLNGEFKDFDQLQLREWQGQQVALMQALGGPSKVGGSHEEIW